MNTTRTPNQAATVTRETPISHLPHSLRSDEAEIGAIVQSTNTYNGSERRASRRIPKTLEISVQPLNDQLEESGNPFFAITRDISQGGLAYLSSRRADFEKAVITINEGIGPGIVCRICNSSVIHSSGIEEFCLTNVQFLFLRKTTP